MSFWLFFVFLLACMGAGTTGAVFPPGAWYVKLEKPSWTPPNWVFPVVWTSIYLLISFAGARVAMMEGSSVALAFWALQGAFATLWTPVFFGLRRLRGALPVIGMLWLAVLGATITHWQVDMWAGLAFVPYLVWTTIATALNWKVAQLNPQVQPLKINEA
ncbi:MAG: TspO/MBR family protein [Paracoccaceae bacterium]